jgi:hypothetical protein
MVPFRSANVTCVDLILILWADIGHVHGALDTYVFRSLRILSVRTEAVPLCANSSCSSNSSHASQRYILWTTLKNTPYGLSQAAHNPHAIFAVRFPDVHKRLLFACDKLRITTGASIQRAEAAEKRVETNVLLLQESLKQNCKSFKAGIKSLRATLSD